MNKLVPLMAVAVLLFAACSKKSTTPTPEISLIVGKWHYTADTVKTYTNGTLTNTSTTGGVTTANYLQFFADGHGQAGVDNNTNVNEFAYSVNGTTLSYVTSPSSIRSVAIKKLTANNLVLFFDDSTTSGGTTTRVTEAAYLVK